MKSKVERLKEAFEKYWVQANYVFIDFYSIEEDKIEIVYTLDRNEVSYSFSDNNLENAEEIYDDHGFSHFCIKNENNETIIVKFFHSNSINPLKI